MKPTRLLLDTNVLIDFFAQRKPYFDDMVKIQVAQIMGDVELWVCPHAFPDASYILRRVVPNKELQEMFEKSLEFLKVSSASQVETARALEERWEDFEDSFVSQCAQRIGADYILTRDAKGFERSKVPAVSPAAFLESLRASGIAYDAFEL